MSWTGVSNIYGDVTVFKGIICIDCINCIKCNGFEGNKSAIVFFKSVCMVRVLIRSLKTAQSSADTGIVAKHNHTNYSVVIIIRLMQIVS